MTTADDYPIPDTWLPLIKNLNRLPPGKADHFWFDHGEGSEVGFSLRVRLKASGAYLNDWYHQRRRAGRKRLGSAAVVKEKDARKLARRRNARVELGADLKRERAEQLEAERVKLLAMAKDFVAHKKPSLKPNSYAMKHHYLIGQMPGPHKNWRSKKNVDSWLKSYHGWPANTVTNREISSVLKRCEENSGGPSAIALRSALSEMFTWAIKEGCYGVTVNPVTYARDVSDELDEERAEMAARLLSEAEIVKIWRGVDPDSEFGKCLRLMILTLCRRGEVAKARWCDFDDPERPTRWTFSNQETKTGKRRQKKQMGDHILPVTSLMREIIATVHARAGTERMFGSVYAGNGFQSFSDGKAALDEKIDIPRWKLHHIRRSVSTILGTMGTPPHVIEEILAHSSGGTRSAVAHLYNRSRYPNEVKAALVMWSDRLAELMPDDPLVQQMIERAGSERAS